eukprot:tig00000056_g24071.t1
MVATTAEKGSIVWIPDEQKVWIKGIVAELHDDGTAIVKCDNGERRHVYQQDCMIRNTETEAPPGIINMSELVYLHEPAVLQNLAIRYSSKKIYTYSNCMLIAVNPFEWLNIYDNAHISMYRGKDVMQLEPHAFAIAEKAYRALMRKNERDEHTSQAILVSGESGAGKTETVKIIMEYLAAVSGGMTITKISDMVLKSNPILEAFGNAKTLRNDNSSRFGKFIEIQFDRAGAVVGAVIKHYLLEKSRIVSHVEGERTFHIFYQLCSQGPNALPQFPGMLKPANQYRFINCSSTINRSNSDDAKDYRETIEAMQIIGFQQQEIEDVMRCTAAVLIIGELQFVQASEDAIAIHDDQEFANACALLACSKQDLQAALCTKKYRAGGEMMTVSHTMEQALAARDAMAKGLYGRLFAWLVSRINVSIRNDKAMDAFIGILDIFGFESFEHNSFEQLCINYANEKLQQLFIRSVLKNEQEEYMRERIAHEFVNFSDNQACLDMLEKKGGVLSLLDEECLFPKGSDESFAQKVFQQLSHNEYFMQPDARDVRAGRGKRSFGIRHYARPVTYDTVGFLEKNKDALHPDATALIQRVAWPFANGLFPKSEFPVIEGDKGARIQQATVSAQFKDQLGQLMTRVGPATLNFVCCIKPNNVAQPSNFMHDYVVHQLRCAGVVEAIKVSRSMYPYRLLHSDFVNRFCFLVPSSKIRNLPPQQACQVILDSLSVSGHSFQFGLTKIFFGPGQLEALNDMREAKLGEYCRKIQAVIRRRLTRNRVIEFRRIVREWQALYLREKAASEYRRMHRDMLKRAIISEPPRPGPAAVDLPPDVVGVRPPPSTMPPKQTRPSVVGAAGAAAYTYPEDEDFDESRAVELHCGDLFALLTQNFDKWQQVHGFRQFFKLYEKKVQLMCSIPAFCDRNLVSLILHGLKQGPGNNWNPVEWTSALLGLLRLFSRADENAMNLLKMGGVPAVLGAMSRFPQDPLVQAHGCAIVANLGHHELIKKQLESTKTAKQVLTSMESHPSEMQVQRNGCAALEELIADCSLKEGTDCVQSVVRAMNAFPSDTLLQGAGCSTLDHFGRCKFWWQRNRKMMIKYGSIEAILNAMKAHPNDVRVQAKGIRALIKLVKLDKEKVVTGGGDKLVENALRLHSNALLQEDGKHLLNKLGYKG